MYSFNAENEKSPLIKAGSNVFKIKSEINFSDGLRYSKKQFPGLRYGNNAESPNFLRMPNVYDNDFSKNNFNEKNSHGYSDANLFNHYSADTYGIYNNPPPSSKAVNIQKDMEKYMAKPTNRMKNVLSDDTDKCTRVNSIDPRISYKKSQEHNAENESQSIKYISRQNLNRDYYDSATYLNNINEYDIKESYNVNEERIHKFNKKNIEDYNCVIGKKVPMSPPKYAVDKWPLFYEKYYNIVIISQLL
jgi:hypothetical protein